MGTRNTLGQTLVTLSRFRIEAPLPPGRAMEVLRIIIPKFTYA